MGDLLSLTLVASRRTFENQSELIRFFVRVGPWTSASSWSFIFKALLTNLMSTTLSLPSHICAFAPGCYLELLFWVFISGFPSPTCLGSHAWVTSPFGYSGGLQLHILSDIRPDIWVDIQPDTQLDTRPDIWLDIQTDSGHTSGQNSSWISRRRLNISHDFKQDILPDIGISISLGELEPMVDRDCKNFTSDIVFYDRTFPGFLDAVNRCI